MFLLLNRRFQLLLFAPLFLLLQACIYLPRTTQVFDPECQVMANHMVLEGVQVAAIQRCANEACIALVVGAGLATAASVVVSGTIVIVGNIAYWLEKKSQCHRAW